MDQFIISQNVTPDHSAAFNVIAMGKMLFLLGTGCDANTLRWCELCFITITYLTDMTDIGSLTGSWEWWVRYCHPQPRDDWEHNMAVCPGQD